MSLEKKLSLHTQEKEQVKINITPTHLFNDEKYSNTLVVDEFPQLMNGREFSSRVIQTGLDYLTATTNKQMIKQRINLIKTFIKDYKEDKQLLKHLQIMHLIVEVYAHRDDEFKNIGINGRMLERYYKEVDLFLNKINLIYPQIARVYQNSISRNTIETNILASKVGKYNFLLTSINNERDLEVIGVMDSMLFPNATSELKKLPEIFNNLNQYHLSQSNLSELYALSKSEGIFAALYAEALVAITQEQKGKPYCFAEISEKQQFSMIEGIPFQEVVGTPIPTSITSNESNMRIILSGLHSGGKSILLKTMADYVVNGMMGLVFPAKKVIIPYIDELIYSLEIKKDKWGNDDGKLVTELKERSSVIKNLTKNKLYVCDEFLQHASPDVAEYLEPAILEEIEKTNAAAVIVTHRGELIDENKWIYFHPQFKEENNLIVPDYQFAKGRPDNDVMQKHAEQLLETIAKNPEVKKEDEHRQVFYSQSGAEIRQYSENLKRFRDIVLSGGYLL
ncbi:MAG: hypothetical protein WC758_04520 [Candidatus Woesearchaeota archaeon]|jgi:hypothetical protein